MLLVYCFMIPVLFPVINTSILQSPLIFLLVLKLLVLWNASGFLCGLFAIACFSFLMSIYGHALLFDPHSFQGGVWQPLFQNWPASHFIDHHQVPFFLYSCFQKIPFFPREKKCLFDDWMAFGLFSILHAALFGKPNHSYDDCHLESQFILCLHSGNPMELTLNFPWTSLFFTLLVCLVHIRGLCMELCTVKGTGLLS